MARTADWGVDLMKAHPRLFKIMSDRPERSFGYPFCEASWRDVLVRLCTGIENALQSNETFQFVRIKQKFGIGRFDWDGEVSDETRPRINDAINFAVARSACTCEMARPSGHVPRALRSRDRHADGGLAAAPEE